MKTTVSSGLIYRALTRGDKTRKAATESAFKAAVEARTKVRIPVARKWFGLVFVMGYPTQEEAEDYVQRRHDLKSAGRVDCIALQTYARVRNAYRWHQDKAKEFGAFQPDMQITIDSETDKTIWQTVVAYIASGGDLS